MRSKFAESYNQSFPIENLDKMLKFQACRMESEELKIRDMQLYFRNQRWWALEQSVRH